MSDHSSLRISCAAIVDDRRRTLLVDASEEGRDDLAPLTKNVVLGLLKEYRARQAK